MTTAKQVSTFNFFELQAALKKALTKYDVGVIGMTYFSKHNSFNVEAKILRMCDDRIK